MDRGSGSARVSLTQAPSEAAASGASLGCSDEGAADGDDQDEGEGEIARRRVGARKFCTTLFIDGISEMVGYKQIRELFAQYGDLVNVFVQRLRKEGRRFRFGFVRYALEEHALQAISCVNGRNLGSAWLSVSVAKPPHKSDVDKSKLGGSAIASSVTQGKVADQALQVLPSISFPSARSWRDVVLGKQGRGRLVRFSLGEECIIAHRCSFIAEVPRVPDEILFPEISGCRLGVGKPQVVREVANDPPPTMANNFSGKFSLGFDGGLVSDLPNLRLVLGDGMRLFLFSKEDLVVNLILNGTLGGWGLEWLFNVAMCCILSTSSCSAGALIQHHSGVLGLGMGGDRDICVGDLDDGFCVPRRRGRPNFLSCRGRRKRRGFTVVIEEGSGSQLLDINLDSEHPLVLPEAQNYLGVLTRARRAFIVGMRREVATHGF